MPAGSTQSPAGIALPNALGTKEFQDMSSFTAAQKHAQRIITDRLSGWIPYPPPKSFEIIKALDNAGLAIVYKEGQHQ